EIDRGSVREVGHVLLRQNAADHALVAVAACHLVADLQLALDGDVDLHHLDHTGRQLVTAAQPLDLVLEVLLARQHQSLQVLEQLPDLLFVLPGRDLAPVLAGHARENLGAELDALFDQHAATVVHQLAGGLVPGEDLGDLAEEGVAQDLHFLVARALEPGSLVIFDRVRAFVALRALARENAGIDHDAADSRRHLERAVAHVTGLLAEDRAQQLLLGAELALPFGRDLADQDVARLDLGADAHDARLVQVLERLLADVRNVARDLFLAELGVTGNALELLDVHRGEHVVLGDALTDQDRVFEVEALPGHECHDHVTTERDLAH